MFIAVILSAQCTDKRVNAITARLFARANTPQDILALGQTGLEEYIRGCGLYHSKAKNIIASCRLLCERHGGRVPDTYEELIALPGVGRKTANVLLANLFGQPALAVDTHVYRVARRLGLAEGNTVLAVEKELQQVVPQRQWASAHHWLIWHGREICHARRPGCRQCPVAELCPAAMAEGEKLIALLCAQKYNYTKRREKHAGAQGHVRRCSDDTGTH